MYEEIPAFRLCPDCPGDTSQESVSILISLLGGLTWNGRSRGGVQWRSNTWFRGKNLSTTRLSSTPTSASLSLFFFDSPPLPSRLLSPALIPGGETGEKRGRRERERERREAAQNEAQGREQSAPNKEGLGEEGRRHPPRLTNLKAQVGGGGWGKRVQKAMDTKVSREPRGPLRIQVGGEEGTFEHN